MLFAVIDAGLTIFAVLIIFGCWALYFFALREKPGDKSE